MSVSSVLLTVNIHSYWHVGAAEGRYGGIDLTMLKDRNGLPFLPGTHLKGLIREVAEQLVISAVDGWDARQMSLLFGEMPSVTKDKERTPCSKGALPACVSYGHAYVDRDRAITSYNNIDLTNEFTLLRHFVSLDRFSHVDAGSLYSIEFAVPLTLHADLIWCPAECIIACNGDRKREQEVTELGLCWHEKIAQCLPHITAVGSRRKLGYGLATLFVAEINSLQ